MTENFQSKIAGNRNFFLKHIWTYRSFLLVIIIGAMVNNLEHSADLYMKISDKVDEWQAYSVVIILLFQDHRKPTVDTYKFF